MKIKLLAKVVSTAGAHQVGDVVDLPEEHARRMVQSKRAVEVEETVGPETAGVALHGPTVSGIR